MSRSSHDYVRKRVFHRTNDGRVFFYPLGPFKGFILPRLEFEPVIVKSLARCHTWNFAALVLSVAVGLMFGITMILLAIIGFLDMLHYYIRVRQLTRRLPAMPADLSVRFYASQKDPQELAKLFNMELIMIVMSPFVFLMKMNPLELALACVSILLLIGWTGITRYVLHICRRNVSAGVEHDLNGVKHETTSLGGHQ